MRGEAFQGEKLNGTCAHSLFKAIASTSNSRSGNRLIMPIHHLTCLFPRVMLLPLAAKGPRCHPMLSGSLQVTTRLISKSAKLERRSKKVSHRKISSKITLQRFDRLS